MTVATLTTNAVTVTPAPIVPTPKYTLTTIASFDDATGINPEAALTIDRSGNLYGTTPRGGADNKGTVFKVAAGTSTIIPIVTFNGANGADSHAKLALDGAGNLYGTTESGGGSDDGTVFKITGGTGKFITILNFNGTNGASPRAGVILDSRGNLYGTTSGSVYKIASGTGTIMALASVDIIGDGGEPVGNLALDSHGNLYGTSGFGGEDHEGIVFKIAVGTNKLTTLATFNNTNGEHPYAGLTIDQSDNLFGATANGGASEYCGIVFKIASATSQLTTIATFTGDNGCNPEADLVLDEKGNLYGTTWCTAARLTGTVFRIAAGSGKIETLATLPTAAASIQGFGGDPYVSIISDGHGNFYGTTEFTGANDKGMIFKLTPTSASVAPSKNGAE